MAKLKLKKAKEVKESGMMIEIIEEDVNVYNEIDKVKEVEVWPSRYIPTPTEAEVDLMEIVVKAFRYAFEECPEGFYIFLYPDGTTSTPVTGGTYLQGSEKAIRICGWSAIDLPYIFNSDPGGTEIEGKVWDAESHKWRHNVFDEFMGDIEDWITEVYDRFEVAHERD